MKSSSSEKLISDQKKRSQDIKKEIYRKKSLKLPASLTIVTSRTFLEYLNNLPPENHPFFNEPKTRKLDPRILLWALRDGSI